jgi:hypothetical protein
MYHKIYDFCKVRNFGSVHSNSDVPTPRVEFICQLLQSESIDFQLDRFKSRNITCYNIILKGDSTKMVVAHHDVNNPYIDNANDNSASVINAIALKKIMPHLNVVLLDGEEFGGLGSQRVSEQINSSYFGKIDWVLNLELTGKGGKYFFIGNYPGPLYDHIRTIFNCPVTNTPYNDSVTFRKNGIDSCVINPLPPLKEGKSEVVWQDQIHLDKSILWNCHSQRDTVDSICTSDMREFVEEVLVKILS